MDLFKKRMEQATMNGSLGNKMVEDTNIIEDLTFMNDQNYRRGKIYDWDMNELEEVDFKFEKIKKYSAEGLSVEYYIRFRPNYNPEKKFKDRYYRNDGKERVGFYVDVYDQSKDIYEKWIIVGKDDRVAFDRYNVLKCDWCFEWVNDGKYYNALGCVRSAQDGSVNNLNSDDLGGSSVNDELSIFLPSSYNVSTITLGTRFIISDNLNNPWVYKTIRVKDTTPIGTTKVYFKQALFNPHTDYVGLITQDSKDFIFDVPIDDLPDGFGGKYHMICNCLKGKGLPSAIITDEYTEDWKLNYEGNNCLYVNGQPTYIKAYSDNPIGNCNWNIYIDNELYYFEQLDEYFDIYIEDNVMSIKVINKLMVGYVVTIAVHDSSKIYYDSIDFEVKL